MKVEGEPTPEPTPPSSPKTMITIDDSSMMSRQNENTTLPTLIKVYNFVLLKLKINELNILIPITFFQLEPGNSNLGNQSSMVTINEPEKININRTSQMQPQARQSFVNYKDIPAASNSGLRMKKTNSRTSNKYVY